MVTNCARLIAVASAPGKVILFGEHFVVYGVPAIVTAIDRRAKVTLKRRDDDAIKIESDMGIAGCFNGEHYNSMIGGAGMREKLEPIKIAARGALDDLGIRGGLDILVRSRIPEAVGLGSSGAIAVATVAAVGRLSRGKLSREDILRLSHEPEKFVHVYPSGIDQTISTYGGTIRYERGGVTELLRLRRPLPIVIGNTGIRRSTGDLVAGVRRWRDEEHERFDRLMDKARRISELAVGALTRGDLLELGRLMNENQRLLETIGVSHPVLNEAIEAAREGGAMGAKLTGAGGGGCMIALSPPDKIEAVVHSIKNVVEPIVAKTTKKGVISFSFQNLGHIS